ncbi:MAG TPA: AAA family ATPase [Acidimicrobiales bacterium]|nr:AAA family ATPase [Acidimicrobiales bacterium]
MSPEPDPDFEADELPWWESGPRLITKSAADVTPTKPEWIVTGWLLRRALCLVTGRQGLGKTTLASHLIACLTTGRHSGFPGDVDRAPMRCAVLSLEEPDDRLVARLKAAGADLERVDIMYHLEDHDDEGLIVRRRWQMPKDVEALGKAIVENGLDLVVIDGLGYSISGDSHNYAQVGTALAALAAEADRTGSCIVGLTHPPKGASDPVTSAIGSTAWTSIPRVSMVLGLDPDDESRLVARVSKSNYREPDAGVSFTLASDEEFEVGYVAGLRPSDVAAEQLTAMPATAEEKSDRAAAREFVDEYLAAGPVPSSEFTKAGKRAGFSARTLERARGDRGVVAEKRTDPHSGKTIGWVLSLPDQDATPPSDLPALADWRTGRTGSNQGQLQADEPQRQQAEAGGLDEQPFYQRAEF